MHFLAQATYFKRCCCALALMASSLFVLPACAQDVFSGLRWSYGLEANTPDQGKHVSVLSLRWMTPLGKYQVSSSQSVRSFIHIERTTLDWEGTQGVSSPLYWLGIPLRYQQRQGEQHQFWINLEPGIMTDSTKLDTKSFAINAELGADYAIDHQRSFRYGLMLDRRLGHARLWPKLAYQKRLNKHTYWTLGFPNSSVKHAWREGFASYAYLKPQGGIWRHRVNGKTASVSLQRWHLGAGSELLWRSGVWVHFDAGLQLLSNINASGAGLSSDVSPGFFWQIGLSLKR